MKADGGPQNRNPSAVPQHCTHPKQRYVWLQYHHLPSKQPISCLAAAAAAAAVTPFAAVLEWVKANGGPQSFSPAEDPGVVACRKMYAYFRRHGHDTICMPASWRSSTGEDMLDEVSRNS
jgi:hypothetical protein